MFFVVDFKIEYFMDIGVRTLNYLDKLFQWDNLQKSQFYKGLPQVMKQLPHRVVLHRVLPCLYKEFVNAPMIPFVLPSILQVLEACSAEEFSENILPHLKPVLGLEEPPQVMFIDVDECEALAFYLFMIEIHLLFLVFSKAKISFTNKCKIVHMI